MRVRVLRAVAVEVPEHVRRDLVRLRLVDGRRRADALRVLRRAEPGRRPKTSRSDSELPPSRFAPCMPPAHSPAAKRPGTVDAAVSASTRTPPIM